MQTRLSQPAIAYYAERGVRFAKNTKVVELKDAGATKSAVLQNGEVLACDMVVAGIGVTPITDPLLKSGIELKPRWTPKTGQ